MWVSGAAASAFHIFLHSLDESPISLTIVSLLIIHFTSPFVIDVWYSLRDRYDTFLLFNEFLLVGFCFLGIPFLSVIF